MKKDEKIVLLILTAMFYISGTTLLFMYLPWQAVVGIWLFICGNNLEQNK